MPPTTVRTPVWWSCVASVVCFAVGSGAGFAIRPALEWMLIQFDSAPAPLRVAAEVPTAWAVPIFALTGAVLGAGVVHLVRTRGATLTIDSMGVTLTSATHNVFQARTEIAAATIDGDELVLLDGHSSERLRARVDNLSTQAVEKSFRRHGYNWISRHPYEFHRWVDHHPDLPESAHDLLRSRARALADDLPGSAAQLTEALREQGIAVRDRNGIQGFRRTKVSPQ